MTIDKITIDKLRELGIDVHIVTTAECGLCGVAFEGANEAVVKAQLNEHLDTDCVLAKFLRGFKPDTKMADVAQYIRLADAINSGKCSKKTVDAFLALGTRIRSDT